MKKNSISKVRKRALTKKDVLKMEKLALANILEDVQEDRKEVEEQRLAILNILEDVNVARDELQQKYKELEAISQLTRSLGLSLELDSVMHSTGIAINDILPGAVVAFLIAPLDANYLDENVHIYSKDPVGKENLKYIKKKIKSLLKKEKKSKIYKNNINNLKFEFLYIDDNYKFEEKLKSEVHLPIEISNEKIGFISIFFSGRKVIPKKQLSTINTIVSNVTQTIERLRILVSSEYSRFSNLVDSMSNGVLMFDLNRRVILANPKAEEIIGKKQSKITFKNFLKQLRGIKKSFAEDPDIKDKKKDVDLGEVINQVVKNNEPAVFQDVTINRRTFEIFITPIRDFRREIAGGAIILHDITYLKEISQLKSEFVSVASHQLRTPLTSIRLFTEMLLDESVGKINQDQKEYVGSMYKSALVMIQLVNNLLNLSRIEAGKLEINLKPTDIEALILDIIKETDALARERNCLVKFKKSKFILKKQLTDSNLLRQAIHNLITNAIRYSEPDKCGIIVSLLSKNDMFQVSIKDSGIGIPKKIHDRIFTKFFRADNAVKIATDGNGLGLYIAKTIIDGLKGEIKFKSEENKGTTFYIRLPINEVNS